MVVATIRFVGVGVGVGAGVGEDVVWSMSCGVGEEVVGEGVVGEDVAVGVDVGL